jgi:hypothetical protein
VNALWLAPLAVLLVGLSVLVVLVRDTTRAARDLREGISGIGDIRVALVRIRPELDSLRETARRRPGRP